MNWGGVGFTRLGGWILLDVAAVMEVGADVQLTLDRESGIFGPQSGERLAN